MPIKRRHEAHAVLFGLLLGAGLTGSLASAEPPRPQVLGLIATHAPTPLTCTDQVCSGFFSAFCMQEKRPRPTAGQTYDLAGVDNPVLLATRQDGAEVAVSGADLLEFTGEGSYTSVRISVSASQLRTLGASSFSVAVPSGIALVPRMDDAASATARREDIDIATGPLRAAAEGFFESSNARADAALLLSRMINLLPPSGPASTTRRHRIWEHVADGPSVERWTVDGIAGARDNLDRCNHYVDNGYSVRLRGCLEKSHDAFLKSLNQDYWDSDVGL